MVREIPGGEIVAEALDGVLSGIDTTDALEFKSRQKSDQTARNDQVSQRCAPWWVRLPRSVCQPASRVITSHADLPVPDSRGSCVGPMYQGRLTGPL
jgi:hypothetical protein